ncbi:IS66 family insertion sequence element accessory protein TnpB [Rhizobium anhuiense]|uniref:IS66 family insertion sequence element accessory protein TnpB n=1 Tax=Rhizobium anhuiense TaxID=1184720 RepID=UPI003CC9D6BC
MTTYLRNRPTEALRTRSSCFGRTRQDRLKLIYWDGCGIVMAYKRLEQSGDPTSSHQAEAHAREAIRAFHQKPRATSYSLKSQVKARFSLNSIQPVAVSVGHHIISDVVEIDR